MKQCTIAAVVSLDRLESLSLFAGVPRRILQQLAEHAQEKSIAAGEFILHQHDDGRYIFFLLSGSVQFLLRFEGADHLVIGGSDQPGALLGWSAFRSPFRYTASVRCERAGEVLRLDRDQLDALISDDPRFGYALLRRVATALADRLEQTRELLVAPPWLKKRLSEGLQHS